MISQVCAGVNLCVAVVLLFAACGKVRAVRSLEVLLVAVMAPRVWRLPGVDSRRVAWAAILTEAGAGLALLVTPRTVYPVVSAAVAAPLLAIVTVAVRAARRRLPCGCFGGSGRPAGTYEVVRAIGFALAAAALFLATVLNGAVDPTLAGASVWSWALAAIMIAGAVVPSLRRGPGDDSPAVSPDQSRTPADDEPDEATTDQVGVRSRREVIRGIGVAAAVLGVAAVLPEPPAATGELAAGCRPSQNQCIPNCQAAYDRCAGADKSQKRCCINCYVSCQNHQHECTPGVSCSGNWEDPFGFFF